LTTFRKGQDGADTTLSLVVFEVQFSIKRLEAPKALVFLEGRLRSGMGSVNMMSGKQALDTFETA